MIEHTPAETEHEDRAYRVERLCRATAQVTGLLQRPDFMAPYDGEYRRVDQDVLPLISGERRVHRGKIQFRSPIHFRARHYDDTMTIHHPKNSEIQLKLQSGQPLLMATELGFGSAKADHDMKQWHPINDDQLADFEALLQGRDIIPDLEAMMHRRTSNRGVIGSRAIYWQRQPKIVPNHRIQPDIPFITVRDQ